MGWGMGKATNEDYFEVLDETDHGSILDGDTLTGDSGGRIMVQQRLVAVSS